MPTQTMQAQSLQAQSLQAQSAQAQDLQAQAQPIRTDAAPAARRGLLPGFADPVNDAQTTFRAALRALAHPGRIQRITARTGVPAGLSMAMTALLLTLVDGDTPLWLPPGVNEDVVTFLRFHCGCPFVPSPSLARFAAVPSGHAAPALSACHAGDPAYPDLSTTLLIDVGALADDGVMNAAHDTVSLGGPGIQTRHTLSVAGLPDGFWREWRLNHQRFPLGVDVFLTQGERICGLPRTTRVEN